MAEIDSLEIQLQANAQKANTAIDSLITKLGNLATSLGRVNGSELNTLSANITNLSASMKSINDVGTASFTRLAKNIGQIAGVDSAALNTVASSLNSTASAFNQFTAVSENAAQIGEVAKNIAKLGNKSVQTSITNMPQLATSLTNLLTTLASAPTVSNNVIQMTNALANLASQGSKVGSASRTIQRSLNGVHRSAQTATKSVNSLASAFGKFFAKYFLVIRGTKSLWKSIESTTDYIEAFNYYAVAFGKIGSEWGKDFERFGYDNATDYANSFSERVSALLGKLSGLQVDVEGGLLTADGAKNLGLNIQEVTEFASQLASVTNSLGQTGETTTAIAKSMTMLAGDISSLFNVDYKAVATNLQSGLIGQSRALYKYGIDITNATLATYAYNLGIQKSVSEMTQAEKQQLRVLAILDQSKVAWTDLARTINSPSNMLRQFNTNVKETSMVLGQIFIPVLQKVMPMVNGTTIAVKRLLVSFATLMGIKIDFDAFGQSGYKDAADGLEDIADGYDDVAKAADKAKKGVRGFDELNVISTGTDKTSGTDGSTIDLTDEIVKATEEYEKVWNEAFENMENESSQFADKVGDFFESVFKPFKAWGDKINWKKLQNGFDGMLGFAKKFTKGVGGGFLDFVEGLSDIGAPVINLLADGVDALFTGMSKADPTTFTAIGGALGGMLAAFITYKYAGAIIFGIRDAWVALTTAVTSNPFGALAVAVGAGLGSIIALEQSMENQKEIEIYGDTVANLANNIISVADAVQKNIDTSKDYVENAGLAEMNMAEDLAEKYFDLAEKTELSNTEQELMKQYAEELVGLIPSLSDEIDSETGYLTIQKDELSDLINKTKEYYRTQAAREQLLSSYEEQLTAEKNLQDSIDLRDKAEQEYNDALESYNQRYSEYIANAAEYTDATIPNYQPVIEAKENWEKLSDAVVTAQSVFDETSEHIDWLYGILESEGNKIGEASGTATINKYGESIEANLPKIKPSLLKIGGKVEEYAEDAEHSFKKIGINGVDGFVEGIDDNLSKVEDISAKLGDTSADSTMDSLDEHSPSKRFEKIGLNSVLGYNQGVAKNIPLSEKAMQTYATKLLTAFNVAISAPIKSVGIQTMNGFIEGISSMESALYAKVDDIADRVAKTMQAALEIHSPSRVMFELGAYTTEGFKDGMESLYEATQLSAKDFGFGVVEAVHPQQLYSDYMSSTPTISPMASTTTQNYYNSNTSVDNAETNALLREQNQLLQRILAKEYGITKDDIGKASREYARDYFRRTGREAYTF